VILGRVVQQRSNRHVLVTAVLEHERGDGHQMRDVWNGRRLPPLRGVDDAGKRERFGEAAGQDRAAGADIPVLGTRCLILLLVGLVSGALRCHSRVLVLRCHRSPYLRQPLSQSREG
jgi:hypothetical protein